MEDLVEQLKVLSADFIADAEKNVAGNKAAGTRARKTSLRIEHLCKAFRKASLDANK